MTEKTHILEELGEAALLLPRQVNQGLAANDAIKYLLTLLQAAARHADNPATPVPDLSSERLAAGITDSALDHLVAAARRAGATYEVPRAADLYEQMRGCLTAMLDPIRAASTDSTTFEARPYAERLEALAPRGLVSGESFPAAWVAECARADRTAGDSVHLLVMDLHRELNRLQGSLTAESLDGAAVYGLEVEDRARVAAFMAGLNRTAPLKFDHPGLGTTATRVGDDLMIQNDIGTTDTHVLVVRVTASSVTVTYTDVHPERAEFFRSLFEAFEVHWTQAGRTADWSEEGDYVLLTGRFEAHEEETLRRFLAHLGSRIVFLIDWNRARRALRLFVRNRDAIELLRWGAEGDLGHRALIQLGGGQLIADAVDRAAPQPLPYGKRLDEVLGREAAMAFLRSVLRITSTGLRDAHSERLIIDEIRNELAQRFQSREQRMLDIAAEHTLVISDLAAAARSGIQDALTEADAEHLGTLARRAKQWERDADALVVAARDADVQSPDRAFYGRLLSRQDDVADCLEDVVFLATLLAPADIPEGVRPALQTGADLLIRGARGLVKCVAVASFVINEGSNDDTREFLEVIDEVIVVEHEADDLERELLAQLIAAPLEPRQLHLIDRLSDAMENALDAMAHTALALHDHLTEAGQVRR